MNAPRPATRRGLGRGLGSLIPTAPVAVPSDTSGEPGGSEHASTTSLPSGHERRDRPADDGPALAEDAGSTDPALAPVHGAWFSEIPVGQIVPNRVQPRQVFDEDAMAELVHSIREVGSAPADRGAAHRAGQLRAGDG